MRVLVIGGTGFIGPFVVRRLSAAGHEVIVCHRGKTEADLPVDVRHIHHPSVPLGERGFLAELVPEFRQLMPDVVLDMIPPGERDVQATMDALLTIAGRIVALSSEDVSRAYDRFRGSVDTTRIRQELGYREPIPFDQGMRRAVEWELGHAPEKIDPAQFDYSAEDQVLAGLTG